MEQIPIQTQARIPSDIHQWLTERARLNDRSMNAELIRILKKAKEQETKERQKNKDA